MSSKLRTTSKWISLMVTILFITGIAAGCSSRSPTAAPAASQAATAPGKPAAATNNNPFAQKENISIALWSIGASFTDAPDAVRDALYAKLNITITPVNITWDDYTQKILIWAASGQLPDIFAIDALGTANLKNWVNEKIIQPLPSDLSPYPNVDKMMNRSGMEIYKMPLGDPNGKFYSLPRLNHDSSDGWCTDTAVQVRKDWMANVGVTSDPTTMDQFIDLMVKFANDDPDKDGKNDTIGLTCYNASWLNWFMINFEPGTGGWIKDSTGKWIPAFMTRNSLAGIEALKKLYDAGGLDKDFATLKGSEGRDKYTSNIAGAYAQDATVSTIENYVGAQFEKSNPALKYSDIIDILKPFRAPDGNYYRMISNPGWSETYISSKCDSTKVDRVMRLFDYVLDTDSDGFRLIHFGIKGKDWNLVDGKVVLVPAKDEDGNPVAPISKYPISGFGSLAMWSGVYQATAPNVQPSYQQIFQANNDWLMANAKPQPINLVIPLLDVPDKDEATYSLSDVIVKCVLSSDAEKTWNDLIAGYKANGYDRIIAEVNAAATAAGIR